MSTNRLEAFSDGVIAVAITLLALNITVPAFGGHHSLAYKLEHDWPTYAAYVTSFMTIGIIWINHHVMLSRLREVDHSILILNLLLLMSIGVLPFATHLVATYLNKPGEHVAAAVYAGSLLVMSIFFSILNRHILFPKSHLLSNQMPPETRLLILRRAITGLIPYVLATAIAAVSPEATLAICGAVALFYALPIASSSGAT